MRIRPFREKDRGQVIALWDRCGLTVGWNDPNRDIDRKIARDPTLFLVGQFTEVTGTVMAGYEGHRGWINYLAVHPDHRRKGYGRALIKAAERLLVALGCPKINLQVRSSNRGIIEFYTALGYKQDAVISLGKRLVQDDKARSND